MASPPGIALAPDSANPQQRVAAILRHRVRNQVAIVVERGKQGLCCSLKGLNDITRPPNAWTRLWKIEMVANNNKQPNFVTDTS